MCVCARACVCVCVCVCLCVHANYFVQLLWFEQQLHLCVFVYFLKIFFSEPGDKALLCKSTVPYRNTCCLLRLLLLHSLEGSQSQVTHNQNIFFHMAGLFLKLWPVAWCHHKLASQVDALAVWPALAASPNDFAKQVLWSMLNKERSVEGLVKWEQAFCKVTSCCINYGF